MQAGNLDVGGRNGAGQGSATPDEIARFNAMAAEWWNPDGPMRPLHRMNGLRTGWIADRVQRQFGGSSGRLLDIGCGAGIASETFARQGHQVLGLDAATEAIAAARAHAEGQDLRLAYRTGTPEELLSEGVRFPVITALEVIEHVEDPQVFMRILADLLEPGGMLFLSTLNRTARSFALAKIGAEYLLRWLPVGTHQWRKFITPKEIGTMARAAGLRLSDAAGMTLEPVNGRWVMSRDMAMNYIVALAKR